MKYVSRRLANVLPACDLGADKAASGLNVAQREPTCRLEPPPPLWTTRLAALNLNCHATQPKSALVLTSCEVPMFLVCYGIFAQ